MVVFGVGIAVVGPLAGAGSAGHSALVEATVPGARSGNVERLVQLLEEYAKLIEAYAPLYKKIQAGDFSESEAWAAFGEKMVAWSEKWSEEYLELFMGLSPAEMEQVSREYADLQKRLEAIMEGS